MEVEAQTKVKGTKADYNKFWMKVVWLAVIRRMSLATACPKSEKECQAVPSLSNLGRLSNRDYPALVRQ